jgi:hypothetical protein
MKSTKSGHIFSAQIGLKHAGYVLPGATSTPLCSQSRAVRRRRARSPSLQWRAPVCEPLPATSSASTAHGHVRNYRGTYGDVYGVVHAALRGGRTRGRLGELDPMSSCLKSRRNRTKPPPSARTFSAPTALKLAVRLRRRATSAPPRPRSRPPRRRRPSCIPRDPGAQTVCERRAPHTSVSGKLANVRGRPRAGERRRRPPRAPLCSCSPTIANSVQPKHRYIPLDRSNSVGLRAAAEGSAPSVRSDSAGAGRRGPRARCVSMRGGRVGGAACARRPCSVPVTAASARACIRSDTRAGCTYYAPGGDLRIGQERAGCPGGVSGDLGRWCARREARGRCARAANGRPTGVQRDGRDGAGSGTRGRGDRAGVRGQRTR